MISEWGGVPYAHLSVVLVNLRFVAVVHQTHHWISKSDVFYADHLLFDRLYNKVITEIDALAEKSIGLGTTNNVDLSLQVSQLNKLVQSYGAISTIPQQDELARRSLKVETSLLQVINHVLYDMKFNNTLTKGVDNMLAQMFDDHEGHIYLLKQRCTL